MVLWRISHRVSFIALLFIPFPTRGQDYCYSTDSSTSFRHAFYSGYFPMQNTDNDPITFEGCTAKSLWVFNRHGSRNPYISELEDDNDYLPGLQAQIIQNYNEGRGSLCQVDIDLLASWTQDVTPEQAGDLMGSGYVEMEELGRRYRARLPELFQDPYDPDKVTVRTTDTERTEQSLKAYMAGIFSEHPDNMVIPEPIDPDPFLRYYDFCDKYNEEVVDNPDTLLEQDLFISDSQEMTDMLININQRLGFEDGKQLEYGDVYSMYDTCRLDRARKPNTPSPWCVAFEEDNILVMEYVSDLNVWYKASYGSEFNTEFGCPMIKDMVYKFSLDDNVMPTTTIYSAHSTILPLTFSNLGLFYDEVPLLHDNYADQADRQFISTYLIPFSGNFEFILFNCDEGNNDMVKRILFQYGERTMLLPGCSEELCLLDEFVANNQMSVLCPFDEICENE